MAASLPGLVSARSHNSHVGTPPSKLQSVDRRSQQKTENVELRSQLAQVNSLGTMRRCHLVESTQPESRHVALIRSPDLAAGGIVSHR